MEEVTESELRWINGIEPSKEMLAANGAQILDIECREQPDRLRDLIQAYRTDPALRAQLDKFRDAAAKTGPILFIGMGASYCSSISGSARLQANGRLSFSVAIWAPDMGRCGTLGASNHVRRKCRAGRAFEVSRRSRDRSHLQQSRQYVLEACGNQASHPGRPRVR
jgi:hypothetical protein